jgi:hypothetical protein
MLSEYCQPLFAKRFIALRSLPTCTIFNLFPPAGASQLEIVLIKKEVYQLPLGYYNQI